MSNQKLEKITKFKSDIGVKRLEELFYLYNFYIDKNRILHIKLKKKIQKQVNLWLEAMKKIGAFNVKPKTRKSISRKMGKKFKTTS